MPRRPHQPKLEPLGEILGKILKKRRIPHTASDRQLVNSGGAASALRLPPRPHPESVKRGLLYVRVSAPVWMHQLQYLKEEIVEKLRQLDPPREIRGLFFSVGALPLASVQTDREARRPPLPRLPAVTGTWCTKASRPSPIRN